MRNEVQMLVRIDPKIMRDLRKIKKVTGKPIAHQVRIALAAMIATELALIDNTPSK